MNFKSIKEVINYLKIVNARSEKERNFLRLFLRSQIDNFYYIDSGKFYEVWSTKKLSEPYVIKVIQEKWTDNIKHNQTFPKKNRKIAKHFLYPVWSSRCHSIIVQPKADVSKNAILNAENYFMSNYVMYSDYHDGNVGMFEGHAVIIDYNHAKW